MEKKNNKEKLKGQGKVPKSYKIEDPEIWEFKELDLSGTYSYASYMRWKFHERVELIKGKIFQMGAPTTKHQVFIGDIFAVLHQFLKGKQCRVFVSPFDVRFPGRSLADREVFTVLQPDICVVCDDQKIDDKGCLGAPDIVIEVLSPGNNRKDLDFKFKVYETSGVREYWVLDPSKESMLKYVLNEDGVFVASSPFMSGEVFTSDVFPGFSLNMEELFGFVEVF